MSIREELPQGWAWSRIGDLTDPSVSRAGPQTEREFCYVDISSVDSREKRIVAPKWLSVGNAPTRAKQRLCAGDVLVSMTRPNLNAVAMVPPSTMDGVGSTGFHVLRSAGVVPEWLFYLVQSTHFVDAMVNLVQGVVYPAVRPKDIDAHLVPVAALAEQRRIVAAIEEQFTRLDAAVASLKHARANLKRYRASVLNAAVTGRLVPTEAEVAQAEGRSYETGEQLLSRITGAFQSKVQPQGWIPLPEGWSWTTVGPIGEVQGGIQTQPKRTPREHAFPFLRVANVSRGRLDLSEVHKMELFGNELEKLRLQHGDLLIVEGNGSPSEIGRMAVWAGAIQDCVHQNHIIRVRPNRLLK